MSTNFQKLEPKIVFRQEIQLIKCINLPQYTLSATHKLSPPLHRVHLPSEFARLRLSRNISRKKITLREKNCDVALCLNTDQVRRIIAVSTDYFEKKLSMIKLKVKNFDKVYLKKSESQFVKCAFKSGERHCTSFYLVFPSSGNCLDTILRHNPWSQLRN